MMMMMMMMDGWMMMMMMMVMMIFIGFPRMPVLTAFMLRVNVGVFTRCLVCRLRWSHRST